MVVGLASENPLRYTLSQLGSEASKRRRPEGHCHKSVKAFVVTVVMIPSLRLQRSYFHDPILLCALARIDLKSRMFPRYSLRVMTFLKICDEHRMLFFVPFCRNML